MLQNSQIPLASNCNLSPMTASKPILPVRKRSLTLQRLFTLSPTITGMLQDKETSPPKAKKKKSYNKVKSESKNFLADDHTVRPFHLHSSHLDEFPTSHTTPTASNTYCFHWQAKNTVPRIVKKKHAFKNMPLGFRIKVASSDEASQEQQEQPFRYICIPTTNTGVRKYLTMI